ncbi:hypothetical protein GH714_026499 [Hevea brasiliensis]|uniref:Band 7 domain-containing protein n=1 Tax=Hevea brasiliensis TaxID=3981 RepID=A0A6A6MDJ0_HEVBR|nr:hypothetical protein GH714_026499 [Hevea brasiliensis]
MGNSWCLLCGCVDQANIGIVERWGRFEKLAEPGLHFFNPWPDNVFVQLLCSIQYRVVKENADDAFYELANPKEQIQAYVFDVARALVPRMTLDELFEQKGEVAKAVLEELEKVMGAYGYSIEHILMVDIVPDASVRKAMNEINAAQRLQLASVYKGEAEKVLQVKKAEADAEAKYLGGVGVARQRQAITDGLRENILNFSHKVEGTTAKEVMDLIMVTQYFDTIKDLGNSSKNTTVFIPMALVMLEIISSLENVGSLPLVEEMDLALEITEREKVHHGTLIIQGADACWKWKVPPKKLHTKGILEAEGAKENV